MACEWKRDFTGCDRRQAAVGGWRGSLGSEEILTALALVLTQRRGSSRRYALVTISADSWLALGSARPVSFVHSLSRVMVVVSALLMAACTSTPEVPLGSTTRKPASGSNRLQVLESHTWRLQSAVDIQNQRIAALSPQDVPPIVFGFGGDRISIQGGCNQMGGRYRITAASQIEVDQIVSTRIACKPS